MTADRDVVDEIDALVDAQMEQTRSGYDYNLAQDRCPHCGGQWHGLAITERMEQMRQRYQARQYLAEFRGDEVGEHGYAESVIDPDYRYADDDSRVLCPGSTAPAPAPQPVPDSTTPPTLRLYNSARREMQATLMAFPQRFILGAVADQMAERLDAGVVHVTPTRQEFSVQLTDVHPDLALLLLGRPVNREHFADNGPAYAEGGIFVPGGYRSAWLDEFVNAEPEPESKPEPDPPVENPPQWRHLPALPRPSTRPPMWANTPQSRRRNRRQDNR